MAKECKFCDRVWALFGFALGAVFLYVSVDLISGGKLTSALTSSRGEITDDVAE